MSREAPWGYDKWTHVEVIPKPPPIKWKWYLGPVIPKQYQPDPGPPGNPPTGNEEITVQLTADQQVELSITGEDNYGNPVTIAGNTQWATSDETIVAVNIHDPSHATAVAVGPVGSAAVTVTNDVDQDGTGDYFGSLAIDVVAGVMTEITVVAAEPTDKPA
jgi:hypothetical protein